MAVLIKVLTGVGVTVPVAGTLGGVILATSKQISAETQVKREELNPKSQVIQSVDLLSPSTLERSQESTDQGPQLSHQESPEMDVEDPLIVSHSSDEDHSQRLEVEGPESDLQESQIQLISIPEISPEKASLPLEVSSGQETSGLEGPLKEKAKPSGLEIPSDSPNLVDPSTTTLEQQKQSIEEQVETGNCTITGLWSEIIEKAGLKVDNYYAVSCEGKEEGDIISDKWEGIFPRSIFKNKELDKGRKIEIKLKEEEDATFEFGNVDEEEEPFKVKFSGNSLFIDGKHSQLKGVWNYCDDFDDFVDEKMVAKVRLIHPEFEENTYLLWSDE